jgi:hypothetical protein
MVDEPAGDVKYLSLMAPRRNLGAAGRRTTGDIYIWMNRALATNRALAPFWCLYGYVWVQSRATRGSFLMRRGGARVFS